MVAGIDLFFLLLLKKAPDGPVFGVIGLRGMLHGAAAMSGDEVGQQEALDEAIELLKPGGKLMLIGIPAVEKISFAIDKMRRKEICVQNVRRQVDCVQEALDMIDNKEIDIDFMLFCVSYEPLSNSLVGCATCCTRRILCLVPHAYCLPPAASHG